VHISDLAINRPVTTIMCILVVLILGFVSLTSLNVDLLPEMDFPVAMVMTSYPGAGPQEVESLVTKRLEAVLGTVSNVKNIMSYSMSGQSVVILELEWGTDLDMTTLEMREKIDLARWVFPDDVEQPMVMKMDPNMMPIMMFGLTGEMGQEDLFKLAEDTIAPRLERLPGVASVDISGGREREIRIELDPAKLSAYGITFTQVAGALQGDNLALSGGTVSKGSQDYLVRITGEFVSPQEIGQVAVVTGTGAQVRIKDLGTVIDGQKEVTGFSRINGRDSIAFSIQKQTTGNTVRVSQAVNKALAELKDELPANIEFVPIMDTAEFIQFSIDNVVNNLILGSLLAALVLYIFLRNLRSTLVIAFSIPVSVIGTFILMYFSGMTLNMMSLGGLALGVGMMVDNSIVILENIYRHREEGFNRVEAAKLGARQVAMAVTASTLTTVAVFVPIAWVEGIASQIFRQLALTITFSLAAFCLFTVTSTSGLPSSKLDFTSRVPSILLIISLTWDANSSNFSRLSPLSTTFMGAPIMLVMPMVSPAETLISAPAISLALVRISSATCSVERLLSARGLRAKFKEPLSLPLLLPKPAPKPPLPTLAEITSTSGILTQISSSLAITFSVSASLVP
jgi:HAE1 family hydrophobic/amphiphilic exporter-1